jgi:phosphoadenosine phosphosulfate reductase
LYKGRIAVVSSFGAESGVLLAWVAEIDPDTPVLFLQTQQHFPRTLAYRETLTAWLGLTNVRDNVPDPAEAKRSDPTGDLWWFDPDACCGLRKVVPLRAALAPFDAWVSGRKRHQSPTRAHLALTELVDGKLKINPLAYHSAAEVEAEMICRKIPRHALTSHGYPSIGCAPCTRPVANGGSRRDGRWSHSPKTECGIHAALS